MFFESLFEGLFRFADVTGFTVVACQLVYYTTSVLGMVLVFRSDWDSVDILKSYVQLPFVLCL